VNRDWVLHHLREAHEELGRTIAESDPEYDVGEFMVAMHHSARCSRRAQASKDMEAPAAQRGR
jgi:hypothetical protein